MKIPRLFTSLIAFARSLPGRLIAAPRTQHPRRWASWRNARRALTMTATLATMTALFYAVEGWRGRRAWAKMQVDATARGIATTRAEFQSPVIEEAENAFAAPGLSDFFEPADASSQRWQNVDNRWILGAEGRNPQLAPGGTALVDFKAWRDYLGTTDLVAAFAPHEAELAKIGRATLRPRAEISVRELFGDVDYDDLFQMGCLLAFRGRVYFEAGRVDAAAEDVFTLIRLGQRLNGATRLQLIGALVSSALTSQACELIQQGLATRVWSAETLARFDVELGRLELMRTLRRAYENDTSVTLVALSEMAEGRQRVVFLQRENHAFGLPSGWIWQNAVTLYQTRVEEVLPSIELAARRIDLKRLKELDRRAALWRWRPYGFSVARIWLNNHAMFENCVKTMEEHDLIRIACRLARHRLEHAAYPKNMNELADPPTREHLHDLRTGEPFAYRWFANGRGCRIGSANGEHGFIELE